MDNKFLDQMELAARWKISRKTLEKWRWLGKEDLPYSKFGNKIRYDIADVEAFELSKRLKNTTEEYLKKSKLNK